MAGKVKKSARVSREEKELMYRLYLKLGTYEAVARKVDRHPSTVSKWVKVLEAENRIIIQK